MKAYLFGYESIVHNWIYLIVHVQVFAIMQSCKVKH